MPRVFADPTAELNATNKQRENKKNRKNAETNLTNPRRNPCTAQKRLCDHSPKMKSRNPIRQFPTVCVRNCASSNRTSPHRKSYWHLQKQCRSLKQRFDYGVNVLTTVCTALLVPFTALCATFLVVIAVFFPAFLAVRTGPASRLPTQSPNAT